MIVLVGADRLEQVMSVQKVHPDKFKDCNYRGSAIYTAFIIHLCNLNFIPYQCKLVPFQSKYH